MKMQRKNQLAGYLKHRKGVNDFFTKLIRQSADSPYLGLTKWLNSEGCKMSVPPNGFLIRPDGYGEFSISESEIVPFFLEYDRGTQKLDIVNKKLERYAIAAESKMLLEKLELRSFPKVLMMTSSEKRALNIMHSFRLYIEETNPSVQHTNSSFMITWENACNMENLLGNIWYRFGDSLEKRSFLGDDLPHNRDS
jgi:hypothetical protein